MEVEIGLGEVTVEVTSSVPIGRCCEAAPSGKVASLAAEMDDPERCALAYEWNLAVLAAQGHKVAQ